MDPGVHPVGFVQQSVDGVVLALDLRLEAQAEVLQSGQAAAHLIWVSQSRRVWLKFGFDLHHHHKSPERRTDVNTYSNYFRFLMNNDQT